MPAFLRSLRRILCTLLLGGFCSASLVLLAPGFGLDETQLDPRWNAASLERLRQQGRVDHVGAFYTRFLMDYLGGNLGYSASLQRPVKELLAERASTTAATVAGGLLLGWLLALGAATLSMRFSLVQGGIGTAATLIQCTPVAVVAMILVVAGGRGTLLCAGALGVIIYSRLWSFLRNLLGAVRDMPHVRAARALGCGAWRVMFRSILLVSAPEILSLAGVSVGMAASLVIPLEAIVDVPGVGQLAWQAALGRDIYLLVNLVMVTSFVVLVANSLADWAARVAGGRRA